ncbi:MAG: hypothetical protein ACLQDV_08300 [Candidatus Binataceae bacterium]
MEKKKPKVTDLPTEKAIERLLPKPIVKQLRAAARAAEKPRQSKKKS